MWKPIKNFEELYEINQEGTVRSKGRIITDSKNHTYFHKEKILIPYQDKRGYLLIVLRKENKSHNCYVHRLVAETFIDNPLNYPVVNHLDGNKQNCSVQNLEWTTYSKNNQHAYDNDLKPKGENFYNSKLTEKQVLEIRTKGKYSTYKKIALQYGVAPATIRDVLLQKTWKGIDY